MKASDDDINKDDNTEDKLQKSEEFDSSHFIDGSIASRDITSADLPNSAGLFDPTNTQYATINPTMGVLANGLYDKYGLTVYGGDKAIDIGSLGLEKSDTLVEGGFSSEAVRAGLDVLGNPNTSILATSPSAMPLVTHEPPITLPLEPKYPTTEAISEAVGKVVMTMFSALQEKLETQEQKIIELSQPKPKDWYFSPMGMGCIKGKNFKMAIGKEPYKIFNTIILKDDNKLFREEVIELLGLGKDEEGNHSSNTYAINIVAKKVRKTTGLSSNEFANNGGNLCLFRKIHKRKTIPE